MKFTVTTQKHVVEEFVIEAASEEEAEALAEKAAAADEVEGVMRTSAAVDRESIAVLDVEESSGHETPE